MPPAQPREVARAAELLDLIDLIPGDVLALSLTAIPGQPDHDRDLVNPLKVSRANGSSSQRSISRGNFKREYVASVPLTSGCPSPGGTAISERSDTEPQAVFGATLEREAPVYQRVIVRPLYRPVGQVQTCSVSRVEETRRACS